jgi:hypothetical protein
MVWACVVAKLKASSPAQSQLALTFFIICTERFFRFDILLIINKKDEGQGSEVN